jgi:N-acetylmuramic acid 6-phosphate etherase
MSATLEGARRDDEDAALLDALIGDQLRAVQSVAAVADALCSAADAVAAALRAGGRLIYLGAGASGALALQDGAELPGTFGLDPARLAFVSPGGGPPGRLVDGAGEDDEAGARRAIEALEPVATDLVLAVSASGSTPFTLAGARAAKARGAKVVALACRRGAPLLDCADVAVLVETGPEAVEGSTRLAAGTAEKAALGVISTLACARLGHVHRGLMVNLRPDNAKLRARAVRIVGRLGEVDDETAAAALGATHYDVKAAVVAAAGRLDAQAAKALIEACEGDLKIALARAPAHRTHEFQPRA